MKLKLKDIAQRVGVSPAYLSQVRHGKCPASANFLEKLNALNLNLSEIKKHHDSDSLLDSVEVICYDSNDSAWCPSGAMVAQPTCNR